MTADEILAALEALGTEQTRKTFRRHGVLGPQFGVKFGDHAKLLKKVKVDHETARKLWASGNFDARVFGLMIADPAAATDREIEAWAKDLDGHALAGQFAAFVAKTPFARKKADKWAADKKHECLGTVGWDLVARLAQDPTVPDDWFVARLGEIEKEIHGRLNYVRYAMNGAMIAIALRDDALRRKALAVAAKVGKVEVDHGDTDCKTPDAATYVQKVLDYRAKKAKK